MTPTLFHRVFGSLFGIWLGFILRRPSGTPISLLHSIFFVFVVGINAIYLHASLTEEHPYKRGVFNFYALTFTGSNVLALMFLDQLFYPKSTLPWQEIAFLAVITFAWITLNNFVRKNLYKETWYAK